VALKARIAEELGERVAICGEERVAFPAPGVVAELEASPACPSRKLATLRALAQAALEGTLHGEHLRALGGDAAVEELQRLPRRTVHGAGDPGARSGEPDYLATAEPRMARAAARAYGLDARSRRTSWPAAARRGARTGHGSACCCASDWRMRPQGSREP
jgi:hypothetical protein